jgi:hypothetical protein
MSAEAPDVRAHRTGLEEQLHALQAEADGLRLDAYLKVQALIATALLHEIWLRLGIPWLPSGFSGLPPGYMPHWRRGVWASGADNPSRPRSVWA